MRSQTRVLFLCTGNSCRSQMAEGLCRHRWPNGIACESAGIESHGLNPLAVEVMREIGIDIGGHRSKTIADLGANEFHCVITVCGHADETCPVLGGNAIRIHRGFDDPPKLASNARSKSEALEHYRRVRDEIDAFIATLPDFIVEHLTAVSS